MNKYKVVATQMGPFPKGRVISERVLLSLKTIDQNRIKQLLDNKAIVLTDEPVSTDYLEPGVDGPIPTDADLDAAEGIVQPSEEVEPQAELAAEEQPEAPAVAEADATPIEGSEELQPTIATATQEIVAPKQSTLRHQLVTPMRPPRTPGLLRRAKV